MKGLLRYLPPLSSDYAGVCSALYELGGLVVVINPSGCVRTYAYVDEPRWMDQESLIFSSGLCEQDAIFGSSSETGRTITSLWEKVRAPFIALIGTPIPALIGMDITDLAQQIREHVPVPVLPFSTSGFRSYSEGISDAYCAIANEFLSPTSEKYQGINLIGSTPLDIGSSPLREIHTVLQDNGISILTDWTMGGDLKEIARSSSTTGNLVISSAGLKVAVYMQELFGIPFTVGIPIGRYLTDLICSSFTGENPEEYRIRRSRDGKDPVHTTHPQHRALIIAEPVFCMSMKTCLIHDFEIADVATATLNDISSLSLPEDLIPDHCIEVEEELIQVINDPRYTVIIGDPLFERRILSKEDRLFIPYPHTALSGNIFEHTGRFIGYKGHEFMDERLK